MSQVLERKLYSQDAWETSPFQTPPVVVLFEGGFFISMVFVIFIATMIHNSEDQVTSTYCVNNIMLNVTQLARYVCWRHLPSEDLNICIGRWISVQAKSVPRDTQQIQLHVSLCVILLCSWTEEEVVITMSQRGQWDPSFPSLLSMRKI